MGQGGGVPFDSEKFAKIGKRGEKIKENQEKEGKNQAKFRKKEENREVKAKIGKVLSLCPS